MATIWVPTAQGSRVPGEQAPLPHHDSPKDVLVGWAFSGKIRGGLLGTLRAESLYSRLKRALPPHELFWAPPEPHQGTCSQCQPEGPRQEDAAGRLVLG